MQNSHKETAPGTTFEQEELRGISRSVGEIEWLLLIVVMLYHVFGGTSPEDRPQVVLSMVIYALSIMGFRYANFFRYESRWKLAAETWIMTGFITWALWHTGRLESPLLNCYLLVIITSALALGKLTTLLELALVATCIALLGDYSSPLELVSLKHIAGIVAIFAPFVLVAYITSMFASDIRYGLNKASPPAEADDLAEEVNLRGFAIVAARLFGKAVRQNRPISLLVIECESLKEVNDELGSRAGDALLKSLMNCLKETLRPTDIIALQGGEEFVALLPGTSAAGAQAEAAKLRAAAAHNSLLLNGQTVRTAIRVGIASYPADGSTLDLLMARAHDDVYHARLDA